MRKVQTEEACRDTQTSQMTQIEEASREIQTGQAARTAEERQAAQREAKLKKYLRRQENHRQEELRREAVREAAWRQHEIYMKEALRQAKKAYALGEVPIGCVIVYEGRIIARGYNRRNTDKNTLAHAEITAIRRAAKKLEDWRLEGCTMYITLEPCQMCAGAMMQARLTHAVIGSMNLKAGCAGSVLNLLEMDGFNHKVQVTRGVLEEQCSSLLSAFFRELREQKRMKT